MWFLNFVLLNRIKRRFQEPSFLEVEFFSSKRGYLPIRALKKQHCFFSFWYALMRWSVDCTEMNICYFVLNKSKFWTYDWFHISKRLLPVHDALGKVRLKHSFKVVEICNEKRTNIWDSVKINVSTCLQCLNVATPLHGFPAKQADSLKKGESVRWTDTPLFGTLNSFFLPKVSKYSQ